MTYSWDNPEPGHPAHGRKFHGLSAKELIAKTKYVIGADPAMPPGESQDEVLYGGVEIAAPESIFASLLVQRTAELAFRERFWPGFAYSRRLERYRDQGVGIPCGACHHRNTVRVGPRVYACQAKGCGAFSLVVLGKQTPDGKATGFQTLKTTPTSAESNEAARRLAQAYGRQEYESRD